MESSTSITLPKYWEEMKILADTKASIFEQIRKQKQENQRIFESFTDLEDYFKDVETMMNDLDAKKDKEAIENLLNTIRELKEKYFEFNHQFNIKKTSESHRWNEIIKLEEAVTQLFNSIDAKNNELESIENEIEVELRYSDKLANELENEDNQYQKLKFLIEEQEEKINELKNLAIIEFNEIECLKQEIELLAKKKREKEAEIRTLEKQQKEDDEELSIAQDTYNKLKKDNLNERNNRKNALELNETHPIDKLRALEFTNHLNLRKNAETNNFLNLFLLSVVVVIFVIIIRL
jgi:chromosome segregation ATPase